MATIIHEIIDGYRYLNEELEDPRTRNWFLMGSPWQCLAILTFYIYFIYNLGPKIMKNRSPINLDRIMQAYNVVQILLSIYILYMAVRLGSPNNYKYACEAVDYSNDPIAIQIASVVHLYFVVKIIDLLDTVFFVLRKKQNQVSFLHVYHHTGMVLTTWAAVKYLPGGHGILLGIINSFVHLIMYSHYLVMSLKIFKPWWKIYITQLQLVQFFYLIFHFSRLIWMKECAYPRWPAAVMIPQNFFMIILFGDFYYKTYMKKSAKKLAED
ncbi:PREDICTED: elongation of very long chain fatty acids protein 7-like [Ceratosolen solmsi marchali]|uniref:Elongation of very long chain fatty acids protein n=1 Tax=Ceratosolen solmsi marchali TaxID=326594 RepID=A0AAJ6VN31_9HYME|nr:PREDICTED: elongation of very long chain fatty acids protein 7-like [Ceratosolen solmsi marchali]XP_011495486.1 PREDICTED: elongation of very long chain fatty acids protein 7-like [Ceratosolen solmsi marchali]